MNWKIAMVILFVTNSIFCQGQKSFEGYFDFNWDESKGKISLKVDKLNEEFLYVNSLSAGIGSNDIGLDRGQLGNERIVKFIRSGEKLLLIQPNYKYRAISNNEKEKASVKEAFAESVLWGFKIVKEEDGIFEIDLTPMLLSDAHGVARRLKQNRQGNYKLDASRSGIYLPRTKAFPKNSEFEATITFTGEAQGRYIRSVTPTPDAVTVRMHHSFIELPDDNYTPRVFHPFSGFNNISFYDYATPIYESMEKKYIVRHRLEKKDPNAEISEAIEPIIYYLDPGTPEPVRSALLEGASWWNQAFESAGYKDAFQVKMLPDDADPLDVRYNVIQWVHRSTRGWSYGASVVDPRTGEIIKGHVSLGSLRVRQDFMIAQGLAQPYDESDNNHNIMMEMALARLRQLSAHEVGHTIGLSHNFASSYNDRASVMDYPHPFLELDDNGKLDISQAYDVGIGDWDKRTILYGYQDFPNNTNEEEALNELVNESIQEGFLFISDNDSRPPGGAHPYSHLWDNGKSPVEELKRLSDLRKKAMDNFSADAITTGTPYSRLENILVPIYLAHRYQVEAVSKNIGGINYTYKVKGDAQDLITKPVDPIIQKEALTGLLETLDPDFLEIPSSIIDIIPPAAFGYRRDRETFNRYSTISFDALAAAESSANHTFNFLLNPDRLSRIILQHTSNLEHISLDSYFDQIAYNVFEGAVSNELQVQIRQSNQRLFVLHLLNMVRNDNVFGQVRAEALASLRRITAAYVKEDANGLLLKMMIQDGLDTSKEFKLPSLPSMPPGSPIGCY